MLDWIFALLILIAILTLILSIMLREEDTYWNLVLIPVSTGLWLILALLTAGGIETPYVAYNATTGASSMLYDVYASEPMVYLSYFFMLMGILCIIYLIVTIFGYYYAKLDRQNQQKNKEAEEF
jgi:hypothetical protein